MYSTDPSWSDIIPLPQDDGANPLAQISYTESYTEAISYLRALMAKQELSPRVLTVTESVIASNPAHYTVWLYRAKALLALSSDLRAELSYLNSLARLHPKNYQIWHHRQTIVDRLEDPSGEREFTAEMFALDAKNYHVWSYRQWLVRRFDLWGSGDGDGDGGEEVRFVDGLLDRDVRNNSAWNHRFFVLFGREGGRVEEGVVEREIRVVEDSIFIAPQNPGPWNYVRGVLKKANLPLSRLEKTCLEYAPLDTPARITSSHALDLLADIYAERGDKEDRDKAITALRLLAETYDPIRANYWNYRAGLVKAVG